MAKTSLNKILFTLGLIIALSSCNTHNDISELKLNDKSSSDQEYIDMNLSLDVEREATLNPSELRAIFSNQTNFPKFSFGTPGEKIRVRTTIMRQRDIEGSVHIEEIYKQDLDWTVDGRNVRRLVCNTPLKILRSELTDATTFYLNAKVLNAAALAGHEERFSHTPFHIIGTNSTVSLNVPYMLVTELQRTGAQGRTFSTKSGSTPTFKPLGEMAYVTITNSRDTNVTVTDFRFHTKRDIIYAPILTYPNFSFADVTEANITFSWDQGSRRISGAAFRWDKFGVVAPRVLVPGETVYAIGWCPVYNKDSYNLPNGPGGLRPGAFLRPAFEETNVILDYPEPIRGSYRYSPSSPAKVAVWSVVVK